MSDLNENLITRIEKLEQALLRRNQNQIQTPIDEMSKVNLANEVGVPSIGSGTFGTQTVSVVGGAVVVPAQPSGTVKVKVKGVTVELLKK